MRLAHFSDPHLLSAQGTLLAFTQTKPAAFANKRWMGGLNLLTRRRHHDSALFRALVDDVNAQEVDHVLCTGDVTNLSLPFEFDFARGLFDGIVGGPAHVTVLPGNHDAYVPEGEDLFARAFAPFFTPDPGWGTPWPMVRVRGDVALIALTTSRPTTWFMAYGSVGAEQLLALDRVLADPRLDGKFRLLALHHPPAGARAQNPIRGLHDHRQLHQVLGRRGVDLVLHGHEHVDLSARIRGPFGDIPAFGVPSATYDSRNPALRAAYRIYDLARGGFSAQVRVWDAERRRFAPGPAIAR